MNTGNKLGGKRGIIKYLRFEIRFLINDQLFQKSRYIDSELKYGSNKLFWIRNSFLINQLGLAPCPRNELFPEEARNLHFWCPKYSFSFGFIRFLLRWCSLWSTFSSKYQVFLRVSKVLRKVSFPVILQIPCFTNGFR